MLGNSESTLNYLALVLGVLYGNNNKIVFGQPFLLFSPVNNPCSSNDNCTDNAVCGGGSSCQCITGYTAAGAVCAGKCHSFASLIIIYLLW